MGRRLTIRISPAVLLWLSSGAVVSIVSPPETATVVVCVLGAAHSAVGFMSHGGSHISATGIYLLATGLFVYFPGIYLVLDPAVAPLPSLLTAVNVCYFGQIVSFYFFWQPMHREQKVSVQADPAVLRWGIQAGFLLTLSGTLATAVVLAGTPALVDAAVFVGIVLMAVSACRAPRRMTPFEYGLIGAGFLAYVIYVFAGFGRLTIGALGIAIAVALAHRWPGRSVKVGMLAMLPPTMAYLAASRVAFTASLNPDQGPEVTGLESVVSPLARFSELLDMNATGLLPQMNGASFGAAAVALFPRALWPDKPVGLGAELAQLFRPDLAVFGHSELALFHGEWLLNFGIAGLVLMVPVVALLVAVIDRVVTAVDARPVTDRRRLLMVVALAVIAAGMVDLVWGGAFNYSVRAGTRVLILLVLYVGFAVRSSGRGSRGRPAPRRTHTLRT